MPLIPLLPLFHNLNKEHFEGALSIGTKPLVSVRWSDGRLRKTAGFYRRGPKVLASQGAEIVLSRPVLLHLPKSAIESTLCHEMIHAWIDLVLGIQEGHGFNFYKRMKAINLSQNNFQISVRHTFPVKQLPPKWIAKCPSCGLSFFYRKRLEGVACRKCCQNYFDGRWNARFLLTYEQA